VFWSSLVWREGRQFVPQGGTILEPGDRLLVLAEDDSYETARRLVTETSEA
jgi:Trk K+ transport system NAD-binding subunit